MSLNAIKDRPWQIQACSALSGEGLSVSLRWIFLFQEYKEKFNSLLYMQWIHSPIDFKFFTYCFFTLHSLFNFLCCCSFIYENWKYWKISHFFQDFSLLTIFIFSTVLSILNYFYLLSDRAIYFLLGFFLACFITPL